MGENTKIEWAHHTFNPWYGCQKVGPGCDHCYAEGWAKRSGLVQWGPGAERRRSSSANWRKPHAWNAEAGRLGIRYRVFCASLGDVFDNEVPEHWRADLFNLIAQTPNLDWLLLTKRIGNAERMMVEATREMRAIDPGRELLHNVWLGATVVNQAEADRDIPKLLAIPAAVRFVSMEPLLGLVDLSNYLRPKFRPGEDPDWQDLHSPLDWVIVGGESGPSARPMHGSWAYDLHDQCEAAGVPFLFKQWGEWVNAGARAFGTATGEVRHIRSDGSFWSENDDALQDECADVLTVVRVGKKAAGRDLGGKLHDGYPEAKP